MTVLCPAHEAQGTGTWQLQAGTGMSPSPEVMDHFLVMPTTHSKNATVLLHPTPSHLTHSHNSCLPEVCHAHTPVDSSVHNHTGPCCPCNGLLLEENHPSPGGTIPPLWSMLPFTVNGSTHTGSMWSGWSAQSSTDPNPKFPVPWLPSTCAGSCEGSRARGQGSGWVPSQHPARHSHMQGLKIHLW